MNAVNGKDDQDGEIGDEDDAVKSVRLIESLKGWTYCSNGLAGATKLESTSKVDMALWVVWPTGDRLVPRQAVIRFRLARSRN